MLQTGKLIILLNVCLLMAACSSMANPEINPPKTQAWECEQTGYVVTTADRHSAGLWIFLPGNSLQLKPATGDPGQLYSSSGVSITIQGIEANLETASGTERCHEQRELSVQEAAKFRGVDFLGVGQEPPWRLEIGNGLLLLKTGYEQTRHEFPLPVAQTDQDAARTTYSASSNDQSITVIIDGRACSDSMSGLGYSATVTISFNNKTFKGCGRALH